jgi:hypothetical protein
VSLLVITSRRVVTVSVEGFGREPGWSFR